MGQLPKETIARIKMLAREKWDSERIGRYLDLPTEMVQDALNEKGKTSSARILPKEPKPTGVPSEPISLDEIIDIHTMTDKQLWKGIKGEKK